MTSVHGLLLVDKIAGCTSFDIVAQLRKITREKTIGHAGTLDPFATGVMLLLIGSAFTKRSLEFTGLDKQYEATVALGSATTTYDLEGPVTSTSSLAPSLADIEKALLSFQGTVLQTPPMFSAKKVQGKKLYEYARKGIAIERKEVEVRLQTTLIRYEYPHLHLLIDCSKGTYIRSIAHDLGTLLGCFGHLSALRRVKVGPYTIAQCIPQLQLQSHFQRSP